MGMTIAVLREVIRRVVPDVAEEAPGQWTAVLPEVCARFVFFFFSCDITHWSRKPPGAPTVLSLSSSY